MGQINKDIFIAVVTRGRINSQKTLGTLQPEVLKHVTIFCHEGELEGHRRNWGAKVKDIQEYEHSAKHIGEIREWIAYNAPRGKVIFVDDNVKFAKREVGYKSPRVLSNKNYTDEDIAEYQSEIFNFLWNSLDEEEVGISGISFRPFNFTDRPSIIYNQRFFGIWGLNCKKYYAQDYAYMSDWSLKEDFAAGIAIISSGYKVKITYDYAFDKSTSANAKGGCSTYRSVELQNELTKRFKEVFGDIVTIKEVKNKNWGGEFEDIPRLDVNIRWSKIVKR